MWTSAHFFYQGEVDRLIVKLVGPLVEELRDTDATIDFFFLRYWEGGPHLRLRIRTEYSNGHRDLIKWHASEFFRAFPSEDRLKDPKSFLEFSTALAAREGIRAIPAHYPNDSVQFIDYSFDSRKYGAARGPVERHFGESSRIALGLLNAGLSIDQRRAVAFAAVILAFAACGRNADAIGRRIMSSWSIWMLGNTDKSVQECAFSKAYDERKRELTTLASGAMNSARVLPSGSDDPFATAWFSSLTNLHASLNGGSAVREAIIDTCVHMLMNRLGLSPLREGYVRYLAARATADIPRDSDVARKSCKL
jgi:hypothetical protein